MMRKPPPPVVAGPEVPEPGKGKRGESGHLGYLLRQAAAVFRLQIERELADLDVTPPQFIVLTMLVAYPGMSNADLARIALLTPQTVSVIVANLVRAGALVRRAHAIHGRIQHLDVTPEGKRLLQRCKVRVTRLEQGLVGGLPKSEEAVIRRWLAGVAANSRSLAALKRGAKRDS
jgi:DNA-binding MarR family transcriptional regulator